jgi:hypothetical protein
MVNIVAQIVSSVDKPEEQRITTAADEELVDPRDRDFKTVLKLTNIIGIHWISVILMCLFSAAQVRILFKSLI